MPTGWSWITLLNATFPRQAARQTGLKNTGDYMAKKIYVGNLSYQMTEADLSDMFTQIGAVESVQIITDRDTGRSKGFGFVQMSDDEAAEKAIAQLNGKEINGRALTVNEARPMEKRDRGPRGSGGGGGRGQGGRGGYGRY